MTAAYGNQHDPAYAAAKRVYETRYGDRPGSFASSVATDGLAFGMLIVAREALAPLRALHKPSTIWDECEHRITDDPSEVSTTHPDGKHHYVQDIGWTCERLYAVCSECCVDDVYQSEYCASYHSHGPGVDICTTAKHIYSKEELLAMTSANQESTDDNTSAGASAGASAKLDTVEVLKDVITISWGDRSAWMVRDGDATVWARVVEDEYASGESKEDACLIEYNPGLHFALTPKQARELVIVLSSAIKEYDNKYGIAGDRVIDCKKN